VTEQTRFDLPQDRMPTSWFNIMPSIVQAGMQPLPPLHPATKEPVGPADLLPLFPESLILQEVSTDEWIDIPGAVLDAYRLWRPSPLQRAVRLEKALQTTARIYYKYEGVSPAGSHKPNTAIAQVHYNKEAGTKRIATETGAGQWGSAVSMACAFFGVDCQVFMVKASYEQKPYRRVFMETFGAEVVASPSPTTQAGKKILEDNPDSTGSLGIAISEAVETAAMSGGSIKYALGSVLNHVLLHQTVIGLEAKAQMELAGDTPDVVIGCVGGGSNYAGLAYPFMADRLSGAKPAMRFLATEPAACPTLKRPVRLRLRRHGRHGPDRADVHPRAHVRPRAGARRRAAVSRRCAVAVAARARGPHGGGCVQPERRVRGGDPVRQDRRHRRGTRVGPRDPRRDQRGDRRP